MPSAIVRGNLEGFQGPDVYSLGVSASRKKRWRRGADGRPARLRATPRVLEADLRQTKEEEPLHRDDDPTFLLSSVARSHAPAMGESVLAPEGMGPSPARLQQETAIASHHGRLYIAARLARIEERLACAEDNLVFTEACRRYIELRLDRAFADAAYVAGDVGLALPKW
jgi:hypothetical protein